MGLLSFCLEISEYLFQMHCAAWIRSIADSLHYKFPKYPLYVVPSLYHSFSGKAEAEKSVAKEFGVKSLIIKPAIIAGGTPGEIRPPGPPGVKPVDVEAVAKLAVAGALGDLKGTIDGNDDISAAAS